MDITQIKKPLHHGIPLSGQTLEWLPTDTKESYNRLCQNPVHRAYFESQGWHLPGAISYKINSEGFRCDEFDFDSPCLVTLGCSFTSGIGLPLETIWPELLGKELGLKVANLSWPGAAADTLYRLAEYWVPRLKPTLVVMLAPPQDRVELMLDKTTMSEFRYVPIDVYLPNSLPPRANDDFLTHWFLNEDNGQTNQRKNIRAIKHLCLELNIPCIVLKAHDFMMGSRNDIGYARDALHGGPKAHELITKKILNDWYATQKS